MVPIVSINDPAATAISRVACPDLLEVKVYLETILKDNDQVTCSSILPIVSFLSTGNIGGSEAWLLAWGQSGAGSQDGRGKSTVTGSFSHSGQRNPRASRTCSLMPWSGLI